MSCLHRATFPTRYTAKAFVERSITTDAYWLCPDCRFWVAGSFTEAPVEDPTTGIFTQPESINE
jgi:hypothetical protein